MAACRPLAEIILDLERVRRDWDAAMKRDDGGDKATALDTEQDDLRDEFRTRFKELTGVAWSNVEHATMSGAL